CARGQYSWKGVVVDFW
nr:immunoglobulin heavy chain junction region [Macaca mulatta]